MSEQPPVPPLPQQGSGARRGRSAAASFALVVAGLLLLIASFAVWVDRVALNTDVFTDTATELIEDDAIREAVATTAVDELFDSVDVQAEIEDRAPDELEGLSGLATAGLRQASYQLVDRALRQPALQRLWAASLDESHRTLVQVLEGDGERVSTEGGIVTLDLEQIVLEAADRIGIRDQVEEKLPADVGRIEILRSDELDTAQDGFQLLKTLAWVLPLLTLAAFAVVVLLAPDRRRAFRSIGLSVLVAGVLGLVAANLAGSYVVSSLVDETETRAAAGNAWDIVAEMLRRTFRWQIVVGVLVFVAAWLAGPGRRATAGRRTLAPAVRERARAYAGLAVIVLVLLVAGPVSDFTRFLTIAVLAALGATWIELTRAQTRQEFPDASVPALLEGARTRISGWWDSRRAAATRPEATPRAQVADLSASLANLAALHARGELTDDEYAAAKRRILAD